MSKILVIAEHLNGELNAGLSKVMTCATAIGGEVDVAVLADSAADIAAAAATVEGVSRVLTVERADNAAPLAAVLAPQIAKLAEGYSHVLIAGTTFGKDVLPRAAALLGVQQVSDIMAVHSATSFDRPIYAGNAIVTVDVPAEPLICATVRLASFKAAGEQAAAPIEAASVDAELPSHTRFVGLEAAKGDRPDLQSAGKVVSGGRALGSSEKFNEVMTPLADKLGAAIGASRAAVDAGYAPNDLQVGQTGKIVAPQLYIACGISGAIQHLAGMKDSKVIVAINKDPEAPIFSVADYGLEADLFSAVPELVTSL